MTNTDLVPSSFKDTAMLPPPEVSTFLDGVTQGVIISTPAETLEARIATCSRWFVERDEILLVASGISEKQGTGFLILEWEDCVIDPLFLAILREDEDVLDYLVYELDGEGEA